MSSRVDPSGSGGLRFSIGLVAGPPDRTIATARAAEESGFDLLRVGDVPSTHREAYCSLTLCAVNTDTIRLGPGVSNPRTRHPALTASSIATLDEIAGGRAFLGLGTGDSAVRNLGLEPATLEELRGYVDVVRRLQRDGEAVVDGARMIAPARASAVPIIMAAHGPRSLQLAGEIADGVVVGLGMSPEAVEYAHVHLEAGAAKAERRVDELEVWYLNYVNLGEGEQTVADIAASLAAGGNLLGRSPAASTVPDRHRGALGELVSRYDYSRHVDNRRRSANARLVQELGLSDYLADRFAIVGDVARVRSRLREAERAGVRNLWSIYNRDDVDDFVRTWGRQVISPLRNEPTRKAGQVDRSSGD